MHTLIQLLLFHLLLPLHSALEAHLQLLLRKHLVLLALRHLVILVPVVLVIHVEIARPRRGALAGSGRGWSGSRGGRRRRQRPRGGRRDILASWRSN